MFSGFGCLSQFSQKFLFAKAGVVALEVYTRNGLITQWCLFAPLFCDFVFPFLYWLSLSCLLIACLVFVLALWKILPLQ